ncbi:VanZ family protein [Candidatus Sumerlaeota bacterium]|nr:VanZ family protein [Candidatus Sumerlaeota bacterium]
MPKLLLPIMAVVAMIALIYWLGGRGFGRAQSQAWIDRVRNRPRVHAWLERHHSHIRASAHYFEFGGLFLILYWLWDVALGGGLFRFRILPVIVIAPICALAAHLDELHQLRNGGRQYRREDFIHSCRGIALAAGIVLLQHGIRRLGGTL